jgi:hypothetical protein
MAMQPLQTFVWASSALLLGEAVQAYLSMRQAGRVAKCWRRPWFWLLVLFVALGAGGFAVAMEVQTKINAMFVGLACPFIIHRFLDEQRSGRS